MERKIIVAEDDSLIRMDIVEMLKGNGYSVLAEAKDGLEAVEKTLKHQPEILLLDLKMPYLLGTKVAQMLKEKSYQGCVIMLTAYSSEDYIKEATINNVSGYLIKPLDEKILISQIELLYKSHNEKQRLKKELEKTNQKLKERKNIEKAKGILMKKYSIDEEEAYSKLRKISMEKRMEISMLAEIVNATGDFL